MLLCCEVDPEWIRLLRHLRLQPEWTQWNEVYLANYIHKCSPQFRTAKTDDLIEDLSVVLQLQGGQSMYETLRNAFKLLHERNTRRCREMSASDLRPGINRDVLFKKAPRQFALKKLCASGDATRGRRELVPLYSRLVGNVFHPDVSRWPKTYGLALPIKLADLLTVLDAIRSHNCLAHEFDTELLRCVEDDITPMLTHTIFPECHSGFSGFLHAKMWIMFIGVYNVIRNT